MKRHAASISENYGEQLKDLLLPVYLIAGSFVMQIIKGLSVETPLWINLTQIALFVVAVYKVAMVSIELDAKRKKIKMQREAYEEEQRQVAEERERVKEIAQVWDDISAAKTPKKIRSALKRLADIKKRGE